VRRQKQIFWGIILLLSVGWIVLGTLMTAQVIEGSDIDEQLSAEIETLTADILPAETPLAAFFLMTGLPLALIALYFYWRNRSPARPDAAGALRRQTIFISILSLLFALLLWNMRDVESMLNAGNAPANSPLAAFAYPLRLFVTFVHEAGHSLAALISGGQVQGFTVLPDGSGFAVTAGGNLALILPAGYLGAALFGSLLFYLTNHIPKWTRGLSFLMGLSFVLLTLSYSMPDQGGNMTALLVGIGFGLAIMSLGWFAPRIVNVFVLNTLAILTGLNAVFDLWLLMRTADFSASGSIRNQTWPY